ncbi:MAG: hypothetical protein AAF402_02560 [Pseudomonadota bacterium]
MVVVPLGGEKALPGYEIVDREMLIAVATNDSVTESVACATGKRVVGGGANTTSPQHVLVGSFPSASNRWSAVVASNGPGDSIFRTLRLYAICVDAN